MMQTQKSRMVNLAIALFVLILPCLHLAEAQQATKLSRIGLLSPLSLSTHSLQLEAFRNGLRDLGYAEGKNIVIEYRFAEGKGDRLPELAVELARLKVDVMVVASVGATAAAKKASSTIPIVVAAAGDLVGTGLVASLARPGGNVTGSTSMGTDLSGKRLELIKEIAPKASRIAVLWSPNKTDADQVMETEIAARALGLKIQSVQVKAPGEIEAGFSAMAWERAQALIVIQGNLTLFNRRQIADLALKKRLPSICEQAAWIDEGCLVSYGPDVLYLWRRPRPTWIKS
jgi:putative tryptophan/tyrosine transport system substrate-binding protein